MRFDLRNLRFDNRRRVPNYAALSTGAVAASYLLDTYGNADTAIAFTKLSSTYSGDCILVREDGLGTEASIGFDSNGVVDSTAISAHCTTNNGFIITLYDQSGNTNNQTQAVTSRQYQIYNGTSVITRNGYPCAYADGTTKFYASAHAVAAPIHTFCSWELEDLAARYGIYGDGAGAFSNGIDVQTNGTIIARSGGGSMTVLTTITATTRYLTDVRSVTGDQELRINDSSAATSATTAAGFVANVDVGRKFISSNPYYLKGWLREFIIFTESKAADQSAIYDIMSARWIA